MPSVVREIEPRIAEDVFVRVQQVAQHGEQVLADAADHLVAHERDIRRVLELEPHAALVLNDGDSEGLVPAQNLPDVVIGRPGIQHGKRALAPELVEPTLARIAEPIGFGPRKNLEAAFRGNQRIHRLLAAKPATGGSRSAWTRAS